MQLSGPACVDKTMGYSWASKTHRFDNIVLCPMPLALWDELKTFSLDIFLQSDIKTWGHMILGGMLSAWSEGTFIHELTHGHYIFSGTDLMAGTL
jgi:hypothetical protein